jgi:hypothetical protein
MRGYRCAKYFLYSRTLANWGEVMSQTGYIESVKGTVRSSRTILCKSEYRVRSRRANFQGGVCAILLG